MAKKDFKNSALAYPDLDTLPDYAEIAKKSLKLWDDHKVHSFNPDSGKQVFSVDTPPPYVSASHLHVGHAMSYTQAEIIVRYQRMKGKEVFYPMGFDDNGLPTERHVEQLHNITDKSQITRSKFRELCAEVTQEGAKSYESLWRSLGISVDWNLRYSTIDQRSQRVAQLSFLDLHKKGIMYRAEQPVLWDTKFQTALAQADLETIERRGTLYDIEFLVGGTPAIISTTRPELIPACVAVFYNPEDPRYSSFQDQKATVPLFDYDVPVLPSDKVKTDFGSGLMMVSTFGDSEDVEKWKEHKLDTRIILTPNGRMNDQAGPYANLSVQEAKSRIVKDLDALGLIKGSSTIKQNVSVGERSEQPVEFTMTPQWFIDVLNRKDELLGRTEELNWNPEHMKVRLVNWIQALKYDWNISRQRYYGVPFPVWYVADKDGGIIDTILADEKDLPVDPMESEPPHWAKEKYQGMTFLPETDVMDTWMTSSVSPMINANWKSLDEDLTKTGIFPMDLRVQAHEIIRTWLFYTMIKSHYHTDMLPWKEAMISGWGLNEQGKKISKRSLEQETDASGYNRFNPDNLIEKYGADAVRYWAASAKLGYDLKFSEKEIKRGRSVTTKIWNSTRMAFSNLQGFDPAADYVPFEDRPVEDQWVLSNLNETIQKTTESLDQLDYAAARNEIDRFFFTDYCDRYLELIKLRFRDESPWTEQEIKATQSTLLDCTRSVLGLYAPYIPFITEELYQRAGRFGEPHQSLHQTPWVEKKPYPEFSRKAEMDIILDIVSEVRKLRSNANIGAGVILQDISIKLDNPAMEKMAQGLKKSISTAARANKVTITLSSTKEIFIGTPQDNTVANITWDGPK